jgi:hypothetical protein
MQWMWRRSDAGSNAVDVAVTIDPVGAVGMRKDGAKRGLAERRVFEFGGGRCDYRPGGGSGNETGVLMDIIIIIILLFFYLFF